MASPIMRSYFLQLALIDILGSESEIVVAYYLIISSVASLYKAL